MSGVISHKFINMSSITHVMSHVLVQAEELAYQESHMVRADQKSGGFKQLPVISSGSRNLKLPSKLSTSTKLMW